MTPCIIRLLLLLLMSAGAVMVYISRNNREGIDGDEAFAAAIAGCREYDAVVLGVHKEKLQEKKQRVIILQIRFDQRRRTVVHKCTEKFYGKYSRGQHIPVLFREDIPIDYCILKYDNKFVRKEMQRLFYKDTFLISGLFLAIAGAAGLIATFVSGLV